MTYTVSAADLSDLQLLETDDVKAALQNVAVILATPKGTAPMYRDFGVDMDFLDQPLPVAQVRMIAAVREAVETWEPRCTVTGVSFDSAQAAQGVLVPIVEVEIHE